MRRLILTSNAADDAVPQRNGAAVGRWSGSGVWDALVLFEDARLWQQVLRWQSSAETRFWAKGRLPWPQASAASVQAGDGMDSPPSGMLAVRRRAQQASPQRSRIRSKGREHDQVK